MVKELAAAPYLRAIAMQDAFRQAVLQGDTSLGTWIKIPTTHSIELIGPSGFDFVVIDQEHAPIDRAAADAHILAARYVGVPPLVRVTAADPGLILSVLDSGAAGVMVPHVRTPAIARAVAAACRHKGGQRGLGGTSRSGGYGAASIPDHVAAADRSVVVIAMIEDPDALDHVDEIVQTDGLHAIMIGRGDLTAALGAEAMDSPVIRDAAKRIATAARRAGKAVCVSVDQLAEAQWLHEFGATMFIASSDQGMIRSGARAKSAEFSVLRKS